MDYVFVLIGFGMFFFGFWKGFREFREMGEINEVFWFVVV